MDNAEISSKFPLPVFVTNDSTDPSLPEGFKEKTNWRAISIGANGTASFDMTISEIRGTWAFGKVSTLGGYSDDHVWVNIAAMSAWAWKKL